MIVLFVLLISLLLYRAIGALGVAALATWAGATRYALATMLIFTASAHFTKMKHDLVRMMPDWIPRPMALIYFTGVCEIAGAIGLVLPYLRHISKPASSDPVLPFRSRTESCCWDVGREFFSVNSTAGESAR